MRFFVLALAVAAPFRVGCDCEGGAPPLPKDAGLSADAGFSPDAGLDPDAGGSAPLIMLQPTAASVWAGARTQLVQWDGGLGAVTLELSADDGGQWAALPATLAEGSATVTPPALDTLAARVRLTVGPEQVVSPPFVLDSTPPAVTISQPDGGVVQSSLTVRWSATDDRLAALPISIDVSWDGGWSSLATNEPNDGDFAFATGREGRAVVRVRAVDLAGNVGEASAAFVSDSTPPVFTALAIPGGATSSLFINVAFDVRDDASPVTGYCLKYDDATTPGPSDACWVALAPANVVMTTAPFRLGFVAGTYRVMGWARNAAGLVSSLTAPQGTLGTDAATVVFQPAPPPDLSRVVVSTTPTGSSLTLPQGAPVYVRWRATSAGTLAALPITIFVTTDDSTFTPISMPVANTPAAGCQVTPGDTGCFVWSAGPSSNAYLRVRVGAVDTNGRQSFRSTPPLNVASTLRVIAGTLDPGTGGSAEVAVFTTQNQRSSFTFPQTFIVTERGVVYFNDVTRGLLEVRPGDGVQRLLIRRTGVALDGALSTATLAQPMRLFPDAQGRVLLYDAGLIRRYDPTTMTLTTLVGGGTDSTSDVVAPRALRLLTPSPNSDTLLLFATPDGRIFFQTSGTTQPLPQYTLRVFDPAGAGGAGEVRTVRFSGVGDGVSTTQNLSACSASHLGATFDPVSSVVTRYVLGVVHDNAACPSPSSETAWAIIDPTTGQPMGPRLTENFDEYLGFTTGADGALYRFNRRSNTIDRFDTTLHTFTTLVGTGRNGTCADGTSALSCDLDVSDVWATRTGQLYFFDRGRLRTLDQANRVFTLMGTAMTAGDGSPATEARIGSPFDVKLWSDAGSDVVVFYDGTQFRLREFPIGGVIRTIAGTGSEGVPTTDAGADLQPISYNQNGTINQVFLQVHPATGDVYTNRGPLFLSRLDRSANRWVDVAGGGTRPYYAPQAEDAGGLSVDFTGSYSPKPIGFDGVDLLVAKHRYFNFRYEDGFLKLFALTQPGVPMRTLAGRTGPMPGTLPVDGSPRTSTVVDSWSSASWDGARARWLVLNQNEDTKLRAISEQGSWSTVATIPGGIESFVAPPSTNVLKLVVCRSDGSMAELLPDAGVRSLAWPVPRMRCVGRGFAWRPSTQTYVVPVLQDGVGAIIDYTP